MALGRHGRRWAVAVETCLRPLALAPKTKTHIRNLMHLLFQTARRWELADKNPIELVRQSSRRLRIPRVLNGDEIRLLLAELSEPYRTMVLVAACLGLRVSEIIGLQWGDFDWEKMTVLIQRSVVQCQVGETKTEGLVPSSSRGSRSGGALAGPSQSQFLPELRGLGFHQ
jgi:integrase